MPDWTYHPLRGSAAAQPVEERPYRFQHGRASAGHPPHPVADGGGHPMTEIADYALMPAPSAHTPSQPARAYTAVEAMPPSPLPTA